MTNENISKEFEAQLARAEKSENPRAALKDIYDNLCKSCREAAALDTSEVGQEKIKKVGAIINYFEHRIGRPDDLKTAAGVLYSTEMLLVGKMKPEAYKQEALRFQQGTKHKALGALMMALGSIMLAVGIGLSASGVATVAGFGMVLGGGVLASNGHRLFKAGKRKDELYQNMTELAETTGKSKGV